MRDKKAPPITVRIKDDGTSNSITFKSKYIATETANHKESKVVLREVSEDEWESTDSKIAHTKPEVV